MKRVTRRTSITSVGCTLALAMVLTGCVAQDPEPSPESPDASSRYESRPPAATGDVESVVWNGAYGEPTTFDPVRAFNNQNVTILQNLCEPLLTADSDGQVGPNIAASIDAADDGLSYTINLRDDVTFWDGTPVTAEDVVFSLDRARSPETRSFLAGALSHISSIEGAGTVVTIRLSEPDGLIPSYLAMQGGVVLSKSFVEQAGDDFGTAAAGLMCTGPYKMAEGGWSSGTPLTIVKNPDYWNTDLPLHADSIRFEFITDSSTLTSALRTGEVDGSFQIPGSAITSLETADGDVYYAPGSRSLNLITVGMSSPFAQPEVRRALSKAIDRTQIVDTIWSGAAEPLRASAPPSSWVSAPEPFEAAWEALGAPSADTAAAQKELEGVTGLDAPITIAVPAETENYVRQAEVLQSVAAGLGIKIEIDPMPTAAYGGLFADPAAREGYDALFIEAPLYIPEAIGVYRDQAYPTGLYNYSGYDVPEVTSLIDQAVAESDAVARADLTIKVQDRLSVDLPWIPFLSPDTTLFLSNKLGGDVLNSNVWYPFAAYLGGR